MGGELTGIIFQIVIVYLLFGARVGFQKVKNKNSGESRCFLSLRDEIDTHFLCHRETDRSALQSYDLKLPLRASRMSHFVLDGRMTGVDVAR